MNVYVIEHIMVDWGMPSRVNAGGSATAAGMKYQAEIGALWCARILLQTPLPRSYNLPNDTYPIRVSFETADAINDIRIDCNNDEKLFGQCKRSIRFSSRPQSDWTSVIRQFCLQYLNDGIEGQNNRYILFYEESNRRFTRFQLVLERLRISSERSLRANAITVEENNLCDQIDAIVSRLESEIPEISIIINEVLRRTYLQQISLAEGGQDRNEFYNGLRYNLLHDPSEINQVWDLVRELIDTIQAQRGSIDRNTLRQKIINSGIRIKDTLSFRNDLQILDRFSRENIQNVSARNNVLRINDHCITISRSIVDAMEDVIEESSILIIGEAGSGKTGVITSLAQRLLYRGNRVWFWPTDHLRGESILHFRNQLQLLNSWRAIFNEISSNSDVYLMVDGLDQIKNFRIFQAYNDLFEIAIHSGIKVIATIRSFDLKYQSGIRSLFPSTPGLISEEFIDANYQEVSHFRVPDLTSSELDQVISLCPEIQSIIDSNPEISDIICRLFYLDLLCKMISRGDIIEGITRNITQYGLFQLFWQSRIDYPTDLRSQKIELLTRIVERMVNETSLRVELPSGLNTTLEELISLDIINYPPTRPGWLLEEDHIVFNNNLLFDYVVEQLYIRRHRRDIVTEIYQNELVSYFLRPGLKIFYSYLFVNANEEFWSILLNLEQSAVTLIHKYLCYLVIAEESKNFSSLERMLRELSSENNEWDQIIAGVISAANFQVLNHLFKNGDGEWWLRFALNLLSTNRPQIINRTFLIFRTASDLFDSLSEEGQSYLNQAGIFLTRIGLSEASTSGSIIFPIKWLTQTIEYQREVTSDMIREIISTRELERAGHIQALPLAQNIDLIWRQDPQLAADIYGSIFGFIERDTSETEFGSRYVLPLRSTRSQDYRMIQFILADKFQIFLESNPIHATLALSKAVESKIMSERMYTEERYLSNFNWLESACSIRSDGSSIWDNNSSSHDDLSRMLQSWQEYLISMVSLEDANDLFEGIRNVLIIENEMAALWRRLLLAGCNVPDFYAGRLYSLLLNVELLTHYDLRNVIKRALEVFSPFYSDEEFILLESEILSISGELFSTLDFSDAEDIANRIKISLIRSIPRERRSSLSNDFIEEHNDIINSIDESDEGPIIFEFTQRISRRIEGITTDDQSQIEFLDLLSFINDVKIEDIDEDNYEELYRRIHEIEEELNLRLCSLDESIILNMQNKVLYGYSKIAQSRVPISSCLKSELISKFRRVIQTSPKRTPSSEELISFDSQQGWSTYDPEINAVQGFVYLVSQMNPIPEEDQIIINSIVNHPNPEIKYHFGQYLWSFLSTWPDLIWNTLDQWILDFGESGMLGVFKIIFRVPWFSYLYNIDSERACSLFINLLNAARNRSDPSTLEHLGKWLAVLLVEENHDWVRDQIFSSLESFAERIHEIRGMLDICGGYVLPRTVSLDLIENTNQAYILTLTILNESATNLEQYFAEIDNLENSDNPDWVREASLFFSKIAVEFRLNSKSFAEFLPTLTPSEKNSILIHWWQLIDPILEQYEIIIRPDLLHDLLQGFEAIHIYSLQQSYQWMNRLLSPIQKIASSDYLIKERIMGIIENTLVNFRDKLIEDYSLFENFTAILDSLLDYGWPRAINVAISIDDLFR